MILIRPSRFAELGPERQEGVQTSLRTMRLAAAGKCKRKEHYVPGENVRQQKSSRDSERTDWPCALLSGAIEPESSRYSRYISLTSRQKLAYILIAVGRAAFAVRWRKPPGCILLLNRLDRRRAGAAVFFSPRVAQR